MKKVVMLFVSVAMITTMEAKEKKDPIVMTVAGKEIPLSEFIFIVKKDNTVDLNDKKTVENYVELFKNYKLKVADAEALTIHKAPKFERELADYRGQLQESFLSDKMGEDSALHVVYDRTKYIPGFQHIFFRFQGDQLVTKDTVALYAGAIAAYNRIKGGESFEAVGESLAKDSSANYVVVDYIYPLQMLKVLEDRIYSMEPGDISEPVRSMFGFHLFKLDRKIPNPGKARVAHILTAYPSDEPTDEEIENTRNKSDSIYQKIIAGEDFAELAKAFSNDTVSARRGGLLPYFGLGEMAKPFEETAFAFENIGDVSKPVQTRFGFHILKLADRKPEIPFEEMESYLYESMRISERNFDLYRGFDEKMKARHGYTFYPEAYEELKRLADEYFPADTAFVNRGITMEKVLVRLDTIDFQQNVFVEYMYRKHLSTKTYSLDFMQEVYDLFVREIVTEMERRILERDYPEYNMLLKEYYDGILLFEVSNKRVWGRPAEEHDELEAEWIKELNEKYPVSINWKVIKNIKKYLN
ncbi:MAG: peptidylprolyl isomerase [Tannerella sp.]|jgi:peptidyl-prolyl cis-trans isomerase SurA|nr:peptidylprolyl isomerase [Tannerella sp.]